MTAASAALTEPEPRLIAEPGLSARVASVAEPVIEQLGYRLVRVRVSGRRRLHGADHGRAAGRHHDGRRLRGRLARVVAGARCRRSDRPRLPAGDFLARHRPAAGAQVRLRPLCRPPRQDRDGRSGRRAASDSAALLGGIEGEAVRLARDDAGAGEEPEVLLPIEDMSEAKLVLTDELVTLALRRGKSRQTRGQGGEADKSDNTDGITPASPDMPTTHDPEKRKPVFGNDHARNAKTKRRRLSDGCQRQQARTAADRRRGRPRKVDRPRHRDHRDGRRHRQGGALALRRGNRRACRDRAEDRRAAS